MLLRRSPRCKKCGNNVRLSKLENDKWVCGHCNMLFSENKIDVTGTIFERDIKFFGK